MEKEGYICVHLARVSEPHDADAHTKTEVCGYCDSEVPTSEREQHDTFCMDFVVPCVHAENGCPWTGTRRSLSEVHIPACPYEAIKGFFRTHDARVSTLAEENALLRHRLEASEGMVQIMKRELLAMKAALGPWCRPEVSQDAPWHRVPRIDEFVQGRSPDDPADVPPFPLPPDQRPPSPNLDPANSQSRASLFANIASYFPPALPSSPSPHPSTSNSNPTSMSMPNPSSSPTTTHPYPYSYPYLHSIHTPLSDPRPGPGPSTATPIAPLNLSTNLPGALAGLHSSLSTLAASHDALARLTDLTIASESARTTEELGALRAVVNGLRMHVHAIMMDRNALFLGSGSGGGGAQDGVASAGWPPPPPRFYSHLASPSVPGPAPHPALASSSVSITKL